MGTEFPSALQHLGRLRRLPLAGENASGDGRSWHQVRRQLMSFHRVAEGFVGAVVLEALCLAGQQHGAAAVGQFAVHGVVAPSGRQCFERAIPVLRAALQFEQRFHRPAECRIGFQRTFGVLPRRLRFTLALRFQKQSAQSELLGIGARQHRFEDAA